MIENKCYIFDTSAFIALTNEEQGCDTVLSLISLSRSKKNTIYASFITFTEIYYIILRRKGEKPAKETIAFIRTLPIEQVHSNEQLALSAGKIKAAFRLSLADAFVAATALEKKAILVHKDPEFEVLSKDIQMMPLPYKHAN